MTTLAPVATPTPTPRESLRRVVNVIVPLLLMTLMVFSALPRERLPARLQPHHDTLMTRLRTLSISQTWSMYAPNPSRGHFYLELRAVDADGTVRELEEQERIDWGTAWVWERDRTDIWLHAIARHIEEVNRNRTWYMRGLCVREARRGYDVRRIEVSRVERSIRAPDKVAAGKPLLGPVKRVEGQATSCRVEIIREMLEFDRTRGGQGE